MSFLVWKPAYLVNVKEIDDQHMKLVEIANRLNAAMAAGKGNEVLGKLLTELVAYTEYHFATEHKLMDRIGYADSIKHRREHDQLVATVRDLQVKHDSGAAMLTMKVMGFLRDWLLKHIDASDRALGAALNAKGVR